ncbi:probable cytochrome P450 9f2 [Lutzomyia longipalpis]|uniref:probable cytochrome P450 9f2 n=1 Tax=Lutzomyia longipalpis TaxID=7200 RepID=UPI00248428BD|nr:probable cytochrome P450 9f2 [Lutzomyia longipalpis]
MIGFLETLLEDLVEFIFSTSGLVIVCCSLIYFIYKWIVSNHDVFAKRGIKFIPPRPIFGNFSDFFLGRKNLYAMVKDLYNYMPEEKIYGMFELGNAKYMIKDPGLLKQILVKDFDHFFDRGVNIEEDQDPLISLNIALINGKKWRDIRSTISPAFTVSKMKTMFQLVCECCSDTIDFLASEIKDGKPLLTNMKDLFGRFGTDIIASCAFGLKVNSFRDRENECYRHGQELVDLNGIHGLKFLFLLECPKIFKFLRLSLFSKKFSDFFKNTVWGIMKQREKDNIYRPDIINIMMEARKGKLRYDDSQQEKEGYATVKEIRIGEGMHHRKITDDEILAQCLTFFMAGFSTTNICMCFTAHELAINQDIQKTLLAEVDATTQALGGKPLTYEAVQNMQYLDMVVSESLRLWPPIPTSNRECTKPYRIEVDGTSYSIAVGELIYIPIVAIHHDPKYFPNPFSFDPERFNEQNKRNIIPYSYLPFGAGPRNCIGSRFALMEIKAILYYLLTKFTFEASEKTQIPIKMAKLQFFVNVEKGFWINLKPRN